MKNVIFIVVDSVFYDKVCQNNYRNTPAPFLNKLKNKVENLENRLKTLELAEAFSGTSKNSSEAKTKIDAIIKEIDHCLELMTI